MPEGYQGLLNRLWAQRGGYAGYNPYAPLGGANTTVPTAPASGSTLTPAPSNAYEPAYGGVPQVPDPADTMRRAMGANLGNAGSVNDLAGQTNTFNQNQLLNLYRSALPGFDTMTSKASGNIADNLAGKVPADVINLLQQSAAERGIATGTAGAPNANAAYLRALGLTSLGRQDVGNKQLTEAIQRTPIAPMLNPATFYLKPEDMYQAQLLANIYGSSPQPGAAARAALDAATRGLRQGYGGAGGYGGYVMTPQQMVDASMSGLYADAARDQAGRDAQTAARQAYANAYDNRYFGTAPTQGGNGGYTLPPSDSYANDLYYYTGMTPEDMTDYGLNFNDLFPIDTYVGSNYGGDYYYS